MPPASPTPPTSSSLEKPASAGPLVGSVVIFLMALLGAFYLWGAWLNRHAPEAPPYIPGDLNSTQGQR